MGCWNETCGLTQQTIHPRDDVYAVIILNNSVIQKSCYGNGISVPMSFVISGQYDDYGSIENVKDDFSTQSTLTLFNSYLKDNKLILSEGFYEDIERQHHEYSLVDGLFTNIESLFYAIERGYVHLKPTQHSGTENNQSISFMLFKKSELESMIDTLLSSHDYNYENDTLEVYNDDVKDYLNSFSGNINDDPMMDKLKIREKLREEGITEEEKEELYELLYTFSDRTKSWGGDNLKSKHSTWGNKVSVFTSMDIVDKKSFKILDTIIKDLLTDKNETEIIETISMMLMVLGVFMAFRKSWAPQGHSSQNDSFDLVLDYTERSLRKMYKERQDRANNGYYEEGFPEIVGALSIFDEGKIKCNS